MIANAGNGHRSPFDLIFANSLKYFDEKHAVTGWFGLSGLNASATARVWAGEMMMWMMMMVMMMMECQFQ